MGKFNFGYKPISAIKSEPYRHDYYEVINLYDYD